MISRPMISRPMISRLIILELPAGKVGDDALS
jgi:hypothetical protein